MSSQKIQKPVALVVSGGRTGTGFLGKNMQDFYPSCASFHEPDHIHQDRVFTSLKKSANRFGFKYGIVKKIAGRAGIRNISDRFLAGKLSRDGAASAIIANRKTFYESLLQDFVVESNYAFYGLLPILDKAFTDHTVTALSRHPLDWIKSYLRKNVRYGELDILNYLGMRITARDIPGDPDASDWSSMTQTEKLAWFYGHVYKTITSHAKDSDKVKVWRFEDIFQNQSGHEKLYKLCKHAGSFSEETFTPEIPDGILDTKINLSPTRNTGIADQEILNAVDKYCEDITHALGYS